MLFTSDNAPRLGYYFPIMDTCSGIILIIFDNEVNKMKQRFISNVIGEYRATQMWYACVQAVDVDQYDAISAVHEFNFQQTFHFSKKISEQSLKFRHIGFCRCLQI